MPYACYHSECGVGAPETARSGGWLARARLLLDDGRRECPELGDVLVPTALPRAVKGDWPGAHAIAEPSR